MYKNLLPIGSVVLLKGGEKRLMICGRIVCKGDEQTIYDYVGCLYPEGLMNAAEMYFFNRDVIAECYFVGFQDREELDFRHGVLDKLGALQVVNGQIVPKEC